MPQATTEQPAVDVNSESVDDNKVEHKQLANESIIINDTINNNNINDANILKWNQWVPMEQQLYATFQLAQLCILQTIDELFATAGITYWLCGGTLMGAIRHGGFIPHDDDIDLECYQDDLAAIASIPLDPPLYMGLDHSNGGSTWEGHPVRTLHFFNDLFTVDIFPRPRPLPPGERYFPSSEEVFPLTRYQFHNVPVWGPNRDRCTTYLDRCYGKDWNRIVCVWNHDYNWCHNASFDPRKEVISLQEYNAIVKGAGVPSPLAEPTAALTFQKLVHHHDWDTFIDRLEKYRLDRVIRRNRAEADYKERLAEKQKENGMNKEY